VPSDKADVPIGAEQSSAHLTICWMRDLSQIHRCGRGDESDSEAEQESTAHELMGCGDQIDGYVVEQRTIVAVAVAGRAEEADQTGKVKDEGMRRPRSRRLLGHGLLEASLPVTGGSRRRFASR